MIRLNAMPMDFAPRNKILSHLPAYPSEPEMSEFESAFLCGALKTFRPKKILEIGVASGGTTAIILQTLEDIGAPYEMHSIDLSPNLWSNPNYPTGFLATFAKENVFGTLNGTHKFHLGTILPQVIDEIGDVDFVILDTTHKLPGELLDFLAVLPYMPEGALVVLHDVSLHQFTNCEKADATGILFGAVTAEKFLNFQADECVFRYPNIAALRVNKQTAANIENVFLSLILRWDYFPDEQIKIYRQLYRRFYSDALCEIFQEAVDMNGLHIWAAQQNRG